MRSYSQMEWIGSFASNVKSGGSD